VEAPGGGGEDIAQSAATLGSELDIATAGGASRRGDGGRALVTAADRRAVLDDVSTEKMMTLYGGTTVQHLGGTPSAHWALSLIQRYVWVEGTRATRNSQMKKYKEFAERERRGMPPGEIDLVCYVAWLLCEGRVQVSSFRQYLSAVRTFCEREGMRPLPPSPTESSLLADGLKAAARFESEMPVKEVWLRAGASANQSMLVLQHVDTVGSLATRRRQAIWQVGFCFSFRGGTIGALWPSDFTFESDYRMSVKPDVLKRTDTDCTRNPKRRWYCVPTATPQARNPIAFMRSFVAEAKKELGAEDFMFSPESTVAGSSDFISSQVEDMAAAMGFVAPHGMCFKSHSLRRGMLTEFVLQNPRPDPVVVRERMDWSSDNTLAYFCRDVMRSEASAIYVPGALQIQL